MTTTRMFAFVALAAVTACSDGPGAKEAKATRDKAMKIFSEDTKVVGGVNLLKLRKSKWWKEVQKLIEKDDEEGNLAKIEKACGIKPLEVATAVVIGANQMGGRKYDDEGNRRDEEQLKVVVTGKIDKATLKSCFEKAPEALGKKGAKASEDGEILRLDLDEEEKPMVTYWLDANTFLLTDEKDNAKVKEMAKGGGGPSKMTRELAGKANAGATFWFAADLSGDLKGAMRGMPVVPPDGVWASIDIGGGADIEIGLHYSSGDDAKKALDQAEGVWKMAKNEPEVKKFTEGVNVRFRKSGNDVIVNVTVSEKAAENLYKEVIEKQDSDDDE